MKLTTKGRYAVTAMLDLALHAGAGPVALADIAGRNKISLSYLEQLFAQLRRHSLVESVRGPGGGYRLASEPRQISVATIVMAVNDDVDATRCGGERNCQDGGRCLTHDLWQDLSLHVQNFLQSVTLADLCERATQREQGGDAAIQLPLRMQRRSNTSLLAAK